MGRGFESLLSHHLKLTSKSCVSRLWGFFILWVKLSICSLWYYDALGTADKQADSSVFVELMLKIIRDSLKEITVVGRGGDQDNDQVTDQDKSPTERLLEVMGEDTLAAKELMARLGLSHRPTFRKNYLNPALESDLIERTIPDKPNSRNQKYRRKNAR